MGIWLDINSALMVSAFRVGAFMMSALLAGALMVIPHTALS